MNKKALIGLTTDFSEDQKYSDAPYYALRKNYTEALTKNNSCSLLLPPIISNIDDYINLIDGLIITGGNFDIDPVLYNAKEIHKYTLVNQERCNFEHLLAQKAIHKNIPILGICGGMQLLNIIFGGDLTQHLGDLDKDLVNHEVRPYHESAHTVIIKPDSVLFDITKQTQIHVNSSHHQAIDKLADNFIASGISEDGLIEAIEIKDKNKFMMGVQWHPEYNISPADAAIFERLIQHCENSQS
ncbi:MAG: gamma-glutamyl-gamma-aminobutyrate hydrolase family protein [Rickettsiales bacterium]|nr:gamma-glutamyl-gamma-aminobutyrate hydrolase family protein [Rickettsiales bacterium]